MTFKKIACSLLLASLPLLPATGSAESHTVSIVAGADNTLYEDPDGSYSNGEGGFFLAGRTNNEVDSIRRAVLYFDIAGNLPHDAIVEQASLTLFLERGNGGPRELRLHRLKADWGEGASSVNGGGQGAPAAPGDATWLHAFYPNVYWGPGGGLYNGRVSAVQSVGDPGPETDSPASYTWQSTARMVDDVWRWLRQPEKNFGWILIGDESVQQTAKRFTSKDNTSTGMPPLLEVTYSLPE